MDRKTALKRYVDGWMDRKKIEGRLEGQKNGWLNGYKKIDGWLDRQEKQKDGWMDIKMDGTVENGWMVGWIDKTNIYIRIDRKQKI